MSSVAAGIFFLAGFIFVVGGDATDGAMFICVGFMTLAVK